MRLNKMESISKATSKPFNELITELYVDQTMTAKEISECNKGKMLLEERSYNIISRVNIN